MGRPRITLGLLGIAWLLGLVSCGAPRARKPLTELEMAREASNQGPRLSSEFEPFLRLRKDLEVSVYLRKLAEKICQTSAVLSDAPLGVFIFEVARSPWMVDSWRDYGLPGNRVYLSVSLLKTLDYEAEIAAAIAWELGRILKRHAITRWDEIAGAQKEQGLRHADQFFGPKGVFAFTADQESEAASAGQALLYYSGYDARGMLRLYDKLRALGDKSPYSSALLDRLSDEARKFLAENTPVRNPIVRSPAFLKIQERIQKL